MELSDDPDLFFFTHAYNGKRDYLNYKCHRVFLGRENARADWNCCDYVLDSDFYTNNPRHKRWPIWAAWDTTQLEQPKSPELFLQKKKFACMVVSNAKAKERIAFFMSCRNTNRLIQAAVTSTILLALLPTKWILLKITSL